MFGMFKKKEIITSNEEKVNATLLNVISPSAIDHDRSHFYIFFHLFILKLFIKNTIITI